MAPEGRGAGVLEEVRGSIAEEDGRADEDEGRGEAWGSKTMASAAGEREPVTVREPDGRLDADCCGWGTCNPPELERAPDAEERCEADLEREAEDWACGTCNKPAAFEREDTWYDAEER
jgi:hypothetical protein